jgi:hypothetical protein
VNPLNETISSQVDDLSVIVFVVALSIGYHPNAQMMLELSTPLHHQLKSCSYLRSLPIFNSTHSQHGVSGLPVRLSLEDLPRLDIAVETIPLGVARWLQPPGKDELGCITLSSCRFGGVESRKPPLLTHPLFAVKTSHHRNLDL